MVVTRQSLFNTVFAIGLFFIGIIQFMASPPKLAYVENSKVLESYKVMQDARVKYKQEAESWQANLDTLQHTVQQELDVYNRTRASLPATERRAREEQLAQRQQQYFTYKKAVTDKAAAEEARLTQEVISKADAFMRQYGEAHGYDIVFAATEAGTVVYGKEGVNITQEVIQALNK
ncbi:OmpH family outer membrane protein [Hymenobacter sp. BT186]|uniref:OmpH family outer membrane protein n=1 Tax=Hymenobacter telluris TaxID=2816474 RepID=A0A939F0C6_9BACT|nr:OmpH family outer membrane protein [Hymenobacter telluris]MBO0360810.1 OmpH family outer membrane protein [Hymenobacter telluris]MBW3376839.1 OmpH family outer membrane protein [Hymenobacter norwichensis]